MISRGATWDCAIPSAVAGLSADLSFEGQPHTSPIRGGRSIKRNPAGAQIYVFHGEAMCTALGAQTGLANR